MNKPDRLFLKKEILMSHYQVLNPATGVVEQEFPTATDAQCLAAITAADNAHKAWSKVSIADRAAIVHRIGQLHIDRQDELAADKSRIQIRNNNDNLINSLCYIN
jgi:acyl-CoA reductase-like NAD-dependent aldehyde dehydrogenase